MRLKFTLLAMLICLGVFSQERIISNPHYIEQDNTIAVLPGQECLIRNIATGLFLKNDGTMTSNEHEASNWRVITNDTIRITDSETLYHIYSGTHVMQLSNTGFSGWKAEFTSKGNTTYVMPSETTPGAFKFRYRFMADVRFLNVEVANDGRTSLTAAHTSSTYNDWEFVPSTHPRGYNYRLMSMDRSDGNTKYTLAYRSHDVVGEEVWLSGWIAVPTASNGGPSNADHVLLSTHYTMCKNSEVPSQTSPYDGFTFDLSSNKPVMIEPDYLGYGITNDREHPYCAPAIMAEESVDMLFAAHELLNDLHQMNCATGHFPTYGIGYSQGGAIILACQKYVEMSPKITEAQRKAINWIRTCCGAGPYNSLATISQYYVQNTLSMPVAAPLLVMGMVAAYPDIFGDIRAEDYFSDAFNEAKIVDKVRSTDYTIDELNDMISKACGATMQGMLSTEALDTNSDLTQHLLQALGESDLTRDWSPKADIWFFHNTDDDVVPYLNTISAYKGLKDKCQGSCELYTTGIGMSHTAAAIDFMARMILGGYK